MIKCTADITIITRDSQTVGIMQRLAKLTAFNTGQPVTDIVGIVCCINTVIQFVCLQSAQLVIACSKSKTEGLLSYWWLTRVRRDEWS